MWSKLIPRPAAICSGLVLTLLSASLLPAQAPIEKEHLAELAKLFDAPSEASPIACEVQFLRPWLNFGFRFVTGYMGLLPIKEYAGEGHRFAILTRVTPDDTELPGVILTQIYNAPSIPARNRGSLELDGAFFVGEGSYTVEWLLVDQEGRSCRHTWHIEAKVPHHDRDVKISIPPGTVQPLHYESWAGVSQGREGPTGRLTVYLHVAPLASRRTRLGSYDQSLLLSSMLSLLERTSFKNIKLVAFNLDQQQELFRSDHFDAPDWGRLVQAVTKLELGKVDYSILAHPKGHLNILDALLREELDAAQPSDVVIFLGPSARYAEKLQYKDKATPASGKPHFFYLEYRPPWSRGSEFPDVIEHSVRSLSGKVFNIYRPHDFASALHAVDVSAAREK